MSRWYEQILEISDVEEVNSDYNTVSIVIKNNNIDFYKKYFKEYVVFKYIYINSDCFAKTNTLSHIYKNCFITNIVTLNDNKYIIVFNINYVLTDELSQVMRGIKLNKIKNKIH